MRASAAINVWPLSFGWRFEQVNELQWKWLFLWAACLSPLFKATGICLTSVQKRFFPPPNKKWIFVGSVFNVKWGDAVKSFDCDIYAKKVWLGSLLFVFFPAPLFLRPSASNSLFLLSLRGLMKLKTRWCEKRESGGRTQKAASRLTRFVPRMDKWGLSYFHFSVLFIPDRPNVHVKDVWALSVAVETVTALLEYMWNIHSASVSANSQFTSLVRLILRIKSQDFFKRWKKK